MTMLFTHQPSAIHTFDHNVCSRGGNAFQDALAVQKSPSAASAAAAVAPLQYRAPGSVDLTDNRRSSSFENQATILMPCPKKISGSCVNAFLPGSTLMSSPLPSATLSHPANAAAAAAAAAAHRWGLPSVFEDPEDTLALSAATSAVDNNDGDNFFDQAACAELMEIMSNGSSRSSSNSSSPQPSLHESTAAESSSALPFGFFEDHAAASASALAAAIAANVGIYGSASPIVRANNPLPNDQSFSPSLPDPTPSEIAMHFESFLARHRHQAKVFDFNLNVV